MTDTDKPSPIEVWLTQKNIEVTCMIVHEDETTTSIDVESLSMRGAQREITGWLIADGYTPVGRWETQETNPGNFGAVEVAETMRRFKIED
jgi:hypothetical protein